MNTQPRLAHWLATLKLTTKTPSIMWQPLVVAPTIVIALSIFYVLIDPRPYMISGTDTDHDYIYNALLILDTGFPGRANHPGIPLYYYTAVLIAIGKPFNASTQFALNLGYLSVGIFTAGALSYFFYVLRDAVPRLALWLCLGILLSWPALIFYLSALASDSIAIAIGIAAIGYFWRYWIIDGQPSVRRTVVLGVLFGSAAAMKMTVLPVIAVTWLVVGFGVLHQRFIAPDSNLDYMEAGAFFPRFKLISAILLGPISSAITFLVFLAPAWGVFPIFLRSAAGRADSSGVLGPQNGSLSNFFSWYASNAPFLLGSVLIAAFVGILTILLVWSSRKKFIESRLRANLIIGAVFGSFMTLLFLYGASNFVDILALQSPDQPIIANTPGWNIGLATRQLGPSFAALAVVVLFAAFVLRQLDRNPLAKLGTRPIELLIFPALSIGIVIWSISTVTADRRHQTDAWELQIVPAMEQISSDSTLPEDGRVAFGMSSNGMVGIFELWGDIRYGEEREAAVDKFDRLALFDIKQAVDRIDNPEKRKPTQYTGLKLTIQNIYRALPRYLPPFRDVISLKLEIAADDLVRGKLTNSDVDRIAYLTQEREHLDASREDLESVLRREFGDGTLTTIEYFGRQWEIFDIRR